MTGMNLPCLAQVDLGRLSTLEYDLAQRALTIGAVYGIIVVLGLLVDLALVLRLRRRPWPWREAASRLLWRPWGLGDSRTILLVLACAYVATFALQGHIPALAERLGLTVPSLLILLQSVVFHWAGLACVVALLARRGLPWGSAFGISWRGFPRAAGWGLALLLAAMPLLLLCTLIYQALLVALGHQTSLQDVAFAFADEGRVWMRVYFFALAVFIAPLFEEILFRGILLPAMARRFGLAASAVAVSLLFAVIHGHLPSMATLFLLSLALSAGYLLTGSLMTSVVMHGLFNAVTVTILLTVK